MEAHEDRRPPDDWDPLDPSVLEDQRSAYDRMRTQCPVAHSGFMGWSVFRWDDVDRVLGDPETFSNASRHPAIPNGMDPPLHTRYRMPLEPMFSADAIGRIERRCEEIAAESAATVVSHGRADLVQAFAEPVALRGLCAFLGWPEDQWQALGGWTHENQQATFSRDRAAGRALAILLTEHVTRNLDEHRSHQPPRDTTDALLAMTVDGQTLSDEQLAAALRNWIAGEGTVAGGISAMILHLARDERLQERLRRDPSLIPSAVEEVLRVDDPLVANKRTTTRGVEIGGRRIDSGETVSLMWIAANLDPAAFEDPTTVRLERDQARSLVWGRGLHVCLGAPLARLQIRTAIEQLLRHSDGFAIEGEVRRAVYPSDAPAELTAVFATGGL